MDCLRVFRCSSSPQIHPPRKQFRFLHHNASFLKPQIPLQDMGSKGTSRNLSRRSPQLVVSAVSSTETREEGKKKKKDKMKAKSGQDKVQLHVRLDHQVEFGERVVILGSTEELGSWKKDVPLDWTESGWVCDLEFKGDENIEYKFVIVKKDKTLVWEGGENRVLKLPRGGSFEIVAKWNKTQENVELLPFSQAEDEDDKKTSGDNESESTDGAAYLEVETSPFVGQWQGKAVSFMPSNEHRTQETERKWDISDLEGLALKLVEGEQKARNWWRKVVQLIAFLKNVVVDYVSSKCNIRISLGELID